MGAGGARGPRGPGARRPAARERRAGPGKGGRPELGAAGRARGSGPEPRTIGGRAPRPAAKPRRPRGCGRPGAAQGHAARAAGPGPGQRPSARLQVRGPGRIVSPSGPAHCAAGGGGQAGAHLPSAAAALIGVLPEQLRPGPRAPGRDPNSGGRRAGRSPRASCGDRPLRPSRALPLGGSGRAPGPLTGLDSASLSSPPRLGMSATLRSPGGGRGRGRLLTGRAQSPARDPTQAAEQTRGPGEEGAHRLLLAGGLSGSWVRPSRRPVPHLLCERLRSAIFFLPLVGPLSRPRGPIGTAPIPVSLGSSWDLRRVQQAPGPGGSRSSQGPAGPPQAPQGGPEAEPGGGRKVGQAGGWVGVGGLRCN